MLQVCSDDSLRPAMNCILLEDKNMVATDGHILVIAPKVEEMVNLKGLLKFERLAGKFDWIYTESGERFPDYQYTLDKIPPVEVTDSIAINFDLVATAMRCMSGYLGGTPQMILEFHGVKSPIVVKPYKSDYGIKIVIMPLRLE